MQEFAIEKNTIIDDAESVVNGIRNISEVDFSGIEIIKKFVTSQKSTHFYVDDKGSVKMAPDRGTVYLWLDTGFTDKYGNPLFISLLKNGDLYQGHFFGTAKVLGGTISDHFPRNRKAIGTNISNFRDKYESKISSRQQKHIISEELFLISSCNGGTDAEKSEMAKKLENLHLVFEEEVIPLIEDEPDQSEAENNSDALENWTASEKEITLGILLDKIDELQDYIRELLDTIEKLNSTNSIKVDELEQKNKEYERALVQIRQFMTAENENVEAMRAEKNANKITKGHDLIERKGKILVLGASEINVSEMRGIAKDYGFEKNDFEFETDYSKVVSFSGRITCDGKFCAIIFGACPHKASDTGNWSSLIEKFRQMEYGPVVSDARAQGGKLKITKASFRNALLNICQELEKKD